MFENRFLRINNFAENLQNLREKRTKTIVRFLNKTILAIFKNKGKRILKMNK